jgi:dGTPase
MAIEAATGRAGYACDPAQSRGRLHDEPVSPVRNPFRRDCDRIIHCSAFRRLAHKTQVFVYHEGDHFRTRLTHTLEVMQIARSLARALGLDEDLAEGLALAHDLGHPPFGHAGERALDACLADCGGFDHNAQTFRVVTLLERRYARFDGLNLTWEMLEGLVKHNGPLIARDGTPLEPYRKRGVPQAITAYRMQDLLLWSFPSAEAQVAAIADDIAYNAHDIDDGLRAGLFDIGNLSEVDFLRELLGHIYAEFGELEPPRLAHELVRRLITLTIEDVTRETSRRLQKLAPRTADEIRAAGAPVVAFSPAMAATEQAVKKFLHPHMYRHPRVMRIMQEAEGVVRDLFTHYIDDARALPADWLQARDLHDLSTRRRHVADFIAGMTDRYALIEHGKLFATTPELR